MKKLFLLCFAVAFTSVVHAEELTTDYVGVIRSSGEHFQNSCGVSLELVDASTGSAIGLTNADELEQLHCQKEKDFQAMVKGRVTSKFLFWGGNLEVSSYEVLGEREPASHTVSQRPRSEMGMRERR